MRVKIRIIRMWNKIDYCFFRTQIKQKGKKLSSFNLELNNSLLKQVVPVCAVHLRDCLTMYINQQLLLMLLTRRIAFSQTKTLNQDAKINFIFPCTIYHLDIHTRERSNPPFNITILNHRICSADVISTYT